MSQIGAVFGVAAQFLGAGGIFWGWRGKLALELLAGEDFPVEHGLSPTNRVPLTLLIELDLKREV